VSDIYNLQKKGVKMKPLISIIVPIYNSEKYLDRCVNSILLQTYENIELILVNDGSTDSSLLICEKYKLMDSRVKIINKVNEGVSSARNCGIDIAKGDLIGFVDSDDYIDKEMYNILSKKILEDTDLVVLISHTINRSELLDFDIDYISRDEALFYLFQLKFPTSLWAYLYKRDIIEKTRLNEKIHFFEDFEFNSKIIMKAQKVNLCRSSLYNYEINETSINSQKISYKKMSCLNIYDNLKNEQYINDNLNLKKSSEYFRSHFIISVIISLSNSLDVVDKAYFKLIKNSSKEKLRDVLTSKYVPIKYKIVILLSSFGPKITAKSINLLRGINKD